MFLLWVSVICAVSVGRLDAACPVKSAFTDPTASETLQIVAVTEVKWPGTSYKPSTGKQLGVFKLDDTALRGWFVSHEDRVLYFKSTCAGVVQIWRQNGSNIINHQYVSKTQGIHFTKIEQRSFVYGQMPGNASYRLADHRSRQEAEEDYKYRTEQRHMSDDEEVDRAVGELLSDPDSRLLSKLSQALGEFGVYGHLSRCSLPLHLTAMSVSKNLLVNSSHYMKYTADLENFDCAERKRQAAHTNLLQDRRLRRGLFSSVVGRLVGGGSKSQCSNDPKKYKDCLGMCGVNCWWCWPWVCGDCCFHTGCYQHDRCCEERGMISIPCTFPVGFSCSKFKQYPNCLN